MVIITNLSQARSITADEKYAIVRSYKHPIPGIEQLKALSPSWDLFKTYRDIYDRGQWNKETFDTIYTPRFLDEMSHDLESITAIKKIQRLDKLGHTVVLACFCKDEDLCHRSILAGILRGLGVRVKLQSGKTPDTLYYTAWASETDRYIDR